MAGDASYASVALLLHGNGANNSLTFTDNSATPKTPSSVVGGAKISTTQSKFGGASMFFDGSGDYLRYADDPAWTIGANDFTFECFVYHAGATQQMIASHWRGSAGTDNAFLFYIDTDNTLHFSYSSGATIAGFTSTGTVPANTWTHVAATRSGSTVRLFIGGTLDPGSFTTVGALNDSAQPLLIGGWQSVADTFTGNFNGYIDEFRFTNGLARYTATFTPPAAAFHDGMGQVSGVVTDAAGAAASRIVRAYRRDTGAAAGSTTSDAGTGAYSFYTPTLDEVTVIALDDQVSGTYYNDVVQRVIPA